MIRLALLMLLAAAFGCKTGRYAASSKPMVELKTGGCFGFCPVFRLTVRHNGWVEYEGYRYVERLGIDSFRLTVEETSRLKEKVRQTDLWQYPDRIETNIADAPFATLTVFKDGQSKSVLGSIDRPEPLLELENELKNLAEDHDFMVKQGVNPNEPPMPTRRELIVKLQPELNAGNWIQQFTDLRLLLVRRVPPDNMWVVAYDYKEISERDIILLFKKTEGVLEAQPNRRVEDRD